jgi:hypothetical protein
MRVWLIRLRRLAAAASESLLPLLAIAASGAGLFIQSNSGSSPSIPPWLFYAIAIIFVALWLLQTWFGYVRKTHDPTWALKYQAIWDSNDGYRRRRIAAATIEKMQSHLADLEGHADELSGIDDALDVLEDLGFYVLGEQISPEAAHHHFYWWIQGYWCCARDYITAVQTKGHDPTRWENIKPLFDVTSDVELQRSKRKLTREDLCLTDSQKTRFLAAERSLPEKS